MKEKEIVYKDMLPINGIWICLEVNFYGQGNTKQEAYSNLFRKSQKDGYNNIPSHGNCQYFFAQHFGI